MLHFGQYPVAMLVIGLLIPLFYSAIRKREALGSMAVLLVLGIVMVVMYPLTTHLANVLPSGVGYSLGKLIIFVMLPAGALYYIERWDLWKMLTMMGVRRENLGKSVMLALGAAVVTIAVTLAVSCALYPTPTSVDYAYGAIMFLEAFTEEFFFRGVLLLYMLHKLKDWKVAYATSVISFVLIHPQHMAGFFLMPAVQGILMGMVAFKTRNIMGPWVGHGLNRVIPNAIRLLFGI